MIAVASVLLFAALNMTIMGTALPKIVSKIGGMEYFDWVFTIYMLFSTVIIILAVVGITSLGATPRRDIGAAYARLF